jgi:hypothetical protein
MLAVNINLFVTVVSPVVAQNQKKCKSGHAKPMEGHKFVTDRPKNEWSTS